MRAAVVYESGGPENLNMEERPIPKVRDNWVLIKVRAFGLNRSELMTRKGYSPNVVFPRVLGIECVGEVEDDPSGELSKGQKVMAFMGEMGREYDGSYAEYTLLPRYIIYPIESNLSWEILGAIPEMYQTVHGSLFESLEIKGGETILIRGGTSSIGLLAIQIAKYHGLKVVATTRNDNSKPLLLKNGADEVQIDDGNLSKKITRGVDKLLELVGTKTLEDSLKCVKRRGVVCMTGMLSETWSISNFSPMEMIPATVRFTTYDSGQIRSSAQDFQQFVDLVESQVIKLPLGKVFPFNQLVEAHQLMDSNKASGKIVVTF